MNSDLYQICGLLLKIKSDYGSVIPKSNAFMHNAIFNIQSECPDLFEDIIFDESGITPYSDELESILISLESGEVLSTPNPEYRKYEIKDENYLKKNSLSCKVDFSKAIDIFKRLIEERVATSI